MISLTPEELDAAVGLGVAGNFAGHLEQAGEASDFAEVRAAEGAPKGVFPWYVRGGGLPVNPLSAVELRLPADPAATCQVEPELALWCELAYAGDAVTSVTPTHFGAFNDCSWRGRPGARKISDKKHWGPASQGFSSDQVLPLGGFEPGGTLDRFRLASFLVRGGGASAYGEDAPVAGYGYFHGRLLGWLVEKLNIQEDAGPLEDLRAQLTAAGRPGRALIAIGATRYTPYGEATFLQEGDEAVVVAYDGARHDAAQVAAAVAGGARSLPGASVLRQRVTR